MFSGIFAAGLAYLLYGCTVVLGGAFMVSGWLQVGQERMRSSQWKIPRALYALTASVLVAVFGRELASWSDRHIGSISPWNVWFSSLAVSYLCLCGGIMMLRGSSGAGKRTVQLGLWILLPVSSICAIGIIMGLP